MHRCLCMERRSSPAFFWSCWQAIRGRVLYSQGPWEAVRLPPGLKGKGTPSHYRFKKLVTVRQWTCATTQVRLDSRPLEQCKPALDCQLVAVGGSPGMVLHRGTEHSSDSALSFFSKFCFRPLDMGRIPEIKNQQLPGYLPVEIWTSWNGSYHLIKIIKKNQDNQDNYNNQTDFK